MSLLLCNYFNKFCAPFLMRNSLLIKSFISLRLRLANSNVNSLRFDSRSYYNNNI
jgi:hypothetical protein